MTIPPDDPEAWEDRVRQGDRDAMASLFAAHRAPLRRWIETKLDPRLRGRLSPSDVLQDVYLAAEQRLDHFRPLGDMPFRVWVRLIANQSLVDLHRRHLGAHARDAGLETAFHGNDDSGDSPSLAARLAADLTSPSQAAMRGEALDLLVRAVDAMDPLDREVLSLRHFQEKTNDEVAEILGIPRGTASKRYIRALGRLRAVLEQIPNLLDDTC